MLEPHEYSNGRTVKSPDGDKLTVQGTVTDATGQRFLVVQEGKDSSFTLVQEGTVRDEYEAVTDDTDDTDAQGASSSSSSPTARKRQS